MLKDLRSALALSAMAVLVASTAPAFAAVDVFGGWMLDRDASKLTMDPKTAETVVIMPWGKSGWVWNEMSGGRFQPEDVHKGIKPPPEVDGAQADVAERSVPSTRMAYWATWDGKPTASHGRDPGQVELKRVNDQTFEAIFYKAPQLAGQGAKSNVAFSADGKHLTVTTNSDVRVYDRIDPTNWPSEPGEAAKSTSPLPCSGIWNMNESLTHRTRSPLGPYVQYFGPWGKDGWVRLNTGSFDATGGEMVFNTFNGNAFMVYGGDPRGQNAKQIDAYTFVTQAIRNGKPADKSVVAFSKDCKRLTFTASGTDRRTGKPYIDDTRVYDMIEP
jgi:hypothetical protein